MAKAVITPKPEQGADKTAKPEQEKDKRKPEEADASPANPFLLEDLFPNPVDLFASTLVGEVTGADVMVAIDTNALLLPYKIGKEDLGALGDTYKRLAAEKRLYIPARVAREFIRNRDRNIAELIKAISDQGSKISVQDGTLSPILEGVDGYDELKKAGADLAEGRKAYLKALARVRTGVLAWRGNDPVTTLYAQVFNAANTVEHDGAREELQREWAERLRNKVPPGYKDGSKADSGIGDFLIWKTLLRLGREQKKDLVFVTGEEKADWFVRSAGDPVFARPELLAEYRAASGGKNLHLSSLADLLSRFGATAELVDEVRQAEASANSDVRTARSASPLVLFTTGLAKGSAACSAMGEAHFDYSTADGRIEVPSQQGGFALRFSKASDDRIHLYRSSGIAAIMRLKDVPQNAEINLEDYDASSSSYTIKKGEAFGAVNASAEVLVGRIVDIADDSRGAAADDVRFRYRIFAPGMPITAP